MIIVRFGATYNTAYVFPRYAEVDTWRIDMPAQYARVSGLPGAFDFWGDLGYPEKGLTLRKSFLVTGDTYAAVQTALEALKAATIDKATESKLYMLKRSGVTTHYAWAKCVGLKMSDQAGQIYAVRAEVEFFSREASSHIF